MWDSNQMIMFNETAANIAGDELGDMAFESIGGEIENPIENTEMKEDASYFNKTLKETRLEVEYLLDKGIQQIQLILYLYFLLDLLL